jgi:SnoaL-like domain
MTKADRLATLEQRVDEMSRQLGLLQDIHAVRTLHFKYGYYMDKCLFREIVDLFSDECEIRFLNAIYRGKAGARRLYGSATGMNGPSRGIMFEHLQVQDIVDVAPDRMTAQGRFRCFLQGGVHESRNDAPPRIPAQFWEGGVYENTFVRECGTWKIKVFNYRIVWQAPYEDGWAHSGSGTLLVSPFERTWPDDPHGPDELLPESPGVWPDTFIVPFHYPHPVTGKQVG